MCGIAGFLYRTPERAVEPAVVERMLTRLEHRGPDGAGSFVDGHAGLGMRRLAIVDTACHEIPYFNEDRTLVGVYNGEVYNHEDVRATLKDRHAIQYGSDTETVLHAFEERGIDAFVDFNGMYACAFYDRRADRLTLVRDKAGEKPLYYYLDDEKLVFASEIKAIVAVVDPEFNESAVTFRAFEFCCGTETLFKNVYALEPGDYLVCERGAVGVHSYWKAWDHAEDLPDDEPALVRRLTDLLEDAILLRTRNNVHEFGALVSGGIDSALVACISKPDHIYTLTYDISDDFDELRYAELVARRLNQELVIVRPTRDDYLQYSDEILYYLDMPATWTSFNQFMVLKRARQDVKVILSGEGSDEMFGGYHRYHLLDHDQKIHELKAMEKYGYLIDKYYGSPSSRYARLINRNEDQFDEACNRYLADVTERYFSKSGSVIHGMGLTDFYTSMQVLLTMADRMSMAFAMENRSPFLDHRLIAFAFSMPERLKIKNGITKYLIKKVARKFVPAEIVKRTDKRGFVAPVNHWFGWGQRGKYSRLEYRNAVFDAWKPLFFSAEGRDRAAQWSRAAAAITTSGAHAPVAPIRRRSRA